MPNEQYLEEFVSPAGFKQLQELQAAVAANNKQLQEGITIAKQYTDQIGSAKGIGDFNAKAAQAAKAQEQLNNTIKRGQILESQVEAVRQRNAAAEAKRQAKAQQDEAKAQSARERRRRTIISDSAAEVAAYNASRNGAANLSTTVNELERSEARAASAAASMSAANRTTVATSNQATTAIQQQSAATEEASVGLGTRFANGARKAWSALRQIAYVLPGVGIAGLIGFITAPIVEYISKLDAFKAKAIDVIRDTAASASEFTQAISDVNALGASIKDFQEGLISKTELVGRFNDGIGKNIGELKTAAEVEDFYNKKAANYVQAMSLRAQANAALQASTEKFSEAQKREINDTSFFDNFKAIGQTVSEGIKSGNFLNIPGLIEDFGKENRKEAVKDLKKDANEFLNLFKDLQRQSDEFNKKNGFNFRPTKLKADRTKEDPINFGTTLQDIIKQSEAIFKNDQNSYEKRLGALDSYIQNSQLLAEGDEGKLNLIKLNGEKERTKIIDQANKEQLKLITESEKARVQELLSANNDQFEALEAIREKDTVALEARYNAGKIDKEDYEKELFNIESSYAKDRIAIQIETLAQIVEIQRSDLAIGIGTNEDLKKSEKELSALRIQLAQLQRKEVKQTSEERIKAAEKELSAIKQLTEKSLEFGKALIDGVYTRRLNALSDESAALDKKKQQDIENVNDSVLTEQQKADQIAIINARAESQQSAIDERIRQQKIKQARADKAQAIAQIIIQTALAQIKVIGQAGILGFVFSPLITALGALSLATAIATPIPKFAVGTEHSPEGLAWVGERGTEGRINPDGTTELTPNKPTLTYLEKGTKIIPNHKLYNKMAKPDKSNFAGAEQVPWGQLIASNDRLGKKLSKAFGDQSINSTQVTKGGWKATQTKMSNLQKHIKRNLS